MIGYLWFLLGFAACTVSVVCFSTVGFIISLCFGMFKIIISGSHGPINICEAVFHYILLCYAYVTGRHAPSYPVGRFTKLMLDVLALCSALALQLFLEYSVRHIIVLVNITIEYHAIQQLFRHACDFSFCDVLFQASMQSMVYLGGTNPWRSKALLILFGAAMVYRYRSYSAAVIQLNDSQKLVSSPC